MPLNERFLREQLRGGRDIQSRHIRGGYVCMHGPPRRKPDSPHAKSRDVLEKAGFQGISERFVELLRRPNLWGARGSEFKSRRSDQINQLLKKSEKRPKTAGVQFGVQFCRPIKKTRFVSVRSSPHN